MALPDDIDVRKTKARAWFESLRDELRGCSRRWKTKLRLRSIRATLAALSYALGAHRPLRRRAAAG